ncbi:fibrinogen-like protein 1-like protein [Ambystoma mexicanum]|uniref:fibrinogen-like protein 1-like protein n=1 Tax=Ambystoma mexicanum TaxID=8296 RepID=UPI0037E825C0
MLSSCRGWLVAAALLMCIASSMSEDKTQKKIPAYLADVENIHLVSDPSDILNVGDLKARKIFYTRDCQELYQLGHTESGLYVIRPEGSSKLVVQCYMHDCDGWTVIQKNSFNTEITWAESWTSYKYGFGFIENDHWLGNYYINLITTQKWYKVKIILSDSSNHTRSAEYDSFHVKNADHGYMLRLGTYHGDAGDSLTNMATKNMHDNMKFSTHDQDNDRSTSSECADLHGGGWWYDSCYDAQLNRKNGIHWHTLCNHNCRSSLILVKPIHMYCNRV